MTKTLIAASTIAFLMTAGVALAQTQPNQGTVPPDQSQGISPSGYPSNTGPGGTAMPGSTTQGTVPPAGAPAGAQGPAPTVGIPNTGAGGNAAEAAAVLGASAAIAIAAAAVLARRKTA